MSNKTKAKPLKNRADKNNDAFVKVPVSMPGSLHDFAAGKAERIAKEKGERTNFSLYIRGLVYEDKKREEAGLSNN